MSRRYTPTPEGETPPTNGNGKKAPRRGLVGRVRSVPVERTAVILNADGTAEIRELDPLLNRAETGVYVTEHHALYEIAEPIPAGFVSVYFADDPRPVTKPTLAGYNAKFLDLVTGSWPVHVVGGGFEGPGTKTKWGKILMYGVVAIGLAASGFMWYTERFGGA